MTETWQKHLDKEGQVGVIMMDLSKPFDTINRSLLLGKLDVYGFSRTSLKLMQNCLCSRQQRSSINGSYSNWAKTVPGVAQGFILSPLFCLIYF